MIQQFAVILCQILMYFACFLLFILPFSYGYMDRIWIYIAFTWLSRNFIGLQQIHFLVLLSVLKRLRLMNQGLRQIGNSNYNSVGRRRFVKKTLQCSTKIFHHLHNISEITSFTFSMVSNRVTRIFKLQMPEV